MTTTFLVWRGIKIEVTHGEAPKNRFLERFAVMKVTPAAAHLPLPQPRYGEHHYVGRTEIAQHANFRAYLIARLERDATPALIARNDRVVKASRQLQMDL
jgi:hypothetical protein